MNAPTISGPYHYKGDIHPSFRVETPDRIVACVFAVDGDIERAEREAGMFADALAAPEPSAPSPAGVEVVADKRGTLLQRLKYWGKHDEVPHLLEDLLNEAAASLDQATRRAEGKRSTGCDYKSCAELIARAEAAEARCSALEQPSNEAYDAAAVAALVALAQHNTPADIQELLVRGDPMRSIPPGALSKAMKVALQALSSTASSITEKETDRG